MVKKPKVREEQFALLKQEIKFWNTTIEDARAMLAHARLVKNKNVRTLRKLEKRYATQ